MVNMYRKKLDKIYGKIEKISSKGRDNQIEYFKYIDDLIEKGDYSAFEEVLLIYYKFDTTRERDVDSYKVRSWMSICEQTKPSFLTKLSKLYKTKGIYQSSFDIYIDENSKLLGQIIEKEILNEDSEYYLKNRQYARIMGAIRTHLEVIRESDSSKILIDEEDLSISEENNLLNRYKAAIDYLLS